MQAQYLVPKITKNKLKPLEPDKRLRSKIFSNIDISMDRADNSNSKMKLTNLPLENSARSPPLSKVKSKIYSIID